MTESIRSSVVSDAPRVDAVRDEGVPAGVDERSHGDADEGFLAADQVLVCPRCHGVIVGVQAAAFTPARGRLIVTNGYCRGVG
jgi:hypothetical protein